MTKSKSIPGANRADCNPRSLLLFSSPVRRWRSLFSLPLWGLTTAFSATLLILTLGSWLLTGASQLLGPPTLYGLSALSSWSASLEPCAIEQIFSRSEWSVVKGAQASGREP
jgi:hypothetical protein